MKKSSVVIGLIVTVISFLLCFSFSFLLGTKVGAIRQWHIDRDDLKERVNGTK